MADSIEAPIERHEENLKKPRPSLDNSKNVSLAVDWTFSVINEVTITLMHSVCIMVLFNLVVPDLCSSVRKMTLLHSIATIMLIRLLIACCPVG